MKTMRSKISKMTSRLSLLVLVTWGLGLSAFSQGTAFTYQGRLNATGAPANGSYDLTFSLFDAGTNGSLLAGPLANSATAVSNGLFTVTLDFGNQFPGAPRWLEIGVRTNAGGAFATLSPRQPLTSTPYAVQSANAATAVSANSVAAANISGTLTTTQLPSSVLTNGASGVSISGTFSGNGAGVTNVPGTTPWQTASGTAITAAPNQALLLTNNGLTTVTLPLTANVGDIVSLSGTGANGWQAIPGYGQSIAGYPAGRVWTTLLAGPIARMAMSADGTKLLISGAHGSPPGSPCDLYGPLAGSVDGGASWGTVQGGITYYDNWSSFAFSADGTKFVATTTGTNNVLLQPVGYVYFGTSQSTPFGTVFVAGTNSPFSNFWWSVAASADCSKLVATTFYPGTQFEVIGSPFVSTNSGATWQPTSSLTGTSVASSADGTKVVMAAGQMLVTSTNSGFTWFTNNNAPPANWSWVASSTNGATLVAGVSGGGVYVSTDSGLTWTNHAPTANWNGVACSADGTKLVGVIYGGGIYTSTNSGATWSANNNAPAANWICVVSTGDGNKLVASSQTSTMSSLAAYPGAAGEAVQFQYLGNGVWQPKGVSATQLVGTIPLANLPPTLLTNGQSGIALSGAFSGDGSGLNNLNASQLTAGTVPDARLSSNVALRAGGNSFTGSQLVSGGNVGINTPNPGLNNLQINTNYASANGYALQVNKADYGANIQVKRGPGQGGIALVVDDAAPGDGNTTLLLLRNNTATNIQNLLQVFADGNVCIGPVNPISLLTVSNAYCDGNSWHNASDRSLKENFAAVDSAQILDQVVSLPLESWTYKSQHGRKHLGPVAQDFHAAFGLNGADDKHIATVDEGGVALAAIQGLYRKVEAENSALRAENGKLQARIEKLERLITTKSGRAP